MQWPCRAELHEIPPGSAREPRDAVDNPSTTVLFTLDEFDLTREQYPGFRDTMVKLHAYERRVVLLRA